ncbi:hypothetical protein K501DRAFT_323245 [Backusella circina FSU 941]|nr:hypothetical protein K501DRAFT_323245 [Backusella circina FSU 941]
MVSFGFFVGGNTPSGCIGGIFDEQGQKAPSYYIRNQDVQVEAKSPANTEMNEAEPKKERDLQTPVSQLNEAHKSHLINFLTKILQQQFRTLRHPHAINKEENLQKRADWVEKWMENGMDYLKNYVFVDESGFDISIRRSRGWSPRGSKTITETPSTKATLHSVLGAISTVGVVNMKLRESGNAPEDQLSVPKGTTSEHYLQFISDSMDIMDEFSEMKGYFIILDNAPIHAPEIVDPIIMQREFNAIKQFWSIIKVKVRRTKLSDIENLTTRIIEASEAVPIVHLKNIIQNSVNQFEKCQNKMPL